MCQQNQRADKATEQPHHYQVVLFSYVNSPLEWQLKLICIGRLWDSFALKPGTLKLKDCLFITKRSLAYINMTKASTAVQKYNVHGRYA